MPVSFMFLFCLDESEHLKMLLEDVLLFRLQWICMQKQLSAVQAMKTEKRKFHFHYILYLKGRNSVLGINICPPNRIKSHDDFPFVSKISTLNKILLSQGVDLDRLWHAIDQVIVKTIISAWPILKHSYHACFPSHDMVLFSCIVI